MDLTEIGKAARKAAAMLGESGQVGREEHLTASFTVPADGNITADATLMGTDFKWFSSITPTKEEFLSGTLTERYPQGGSNTIRIGNLSHSVVAEATGAYCIRIGDVAYIVSAVTENELGSIPKTGMYYSTAPVIAVPEFYGGTLTLDFGTTIHPINEKFLPQTIINLYDYGVNIMELVASGTSGRKDLGDMSTLWGKIRADGRRIVLISDDGVNVAFMLQNVTISYSNDHVYQLASQASMINGDHIVSLGLYLTNETTPIGGSVTTLSYTINMSAKPE